MPRHKLSACHTKSVPATDVHRTPKAFFKYIQAQLLMACTLDVAATKKNRLCTSYIDKARDGLKTPWRGTVWCNPPYSIVGAFVQRAVDMAQQKKAHSILLVAARTDRKWWALTEGAYAIVYIRGRLKFVGAKSGAPFPSVVLVFRAGYRGPPRNLYLSPTPYERGFDRGKPKSK